MKTKKLMLGTLVFVFAIGSAVASALALQPIHVKALLEPNGDEVCVQLDQECEDTGEFDCTVQVPVLNGPDVTSQTYSDSECTIPLRNDDTGVFDASPINPSIQIYELVEPN